MFVLKVIIILPFRYWIRTSLLRLPVPVLGLTFYTIKLKKVSYNIIRYKKQLRVLWVKFEITYWVDNSAQVISFLLESLKLRLAPDWNSSIFRVMCNQLFCQAVLHIAQLAFLLSWNILYRLSFLQIAWQKHCLELFLIFDKVEIIQIVNTMDQIVIICNRVELWLPNRAGDSIVKS